jgi:hypothetical protein
LGSSALTPLAEHEIVTTIANMERWHCGIITTREFCEICHAKGYLPSQYTLGEFEKDALHVTGADVYKELDAKDIIAIVSLLLSRKL